MTFTLPKIDIYKLKYTLLLSLLFISGSAVAQTQPDTLKVLFVGNSYIYVSDIPGLVSLISEDTQTRLVTSHITTGGARLSTHWNGERGLRTKDIIKNGDFDIVVLQEQSMGTIQQPQSFLEYSKKFSEYIKEHGAQPFFYATWSRERTPQTQKTITSMYQRAARENKAGIVLVGEAWAMARSQRPETKLYMSDGSHQSQTGAFLSAAMFVKTFSKELPNKELNANGEFSWIKNIDIPFLFGIANELNK